MNLTGLFYNKTEADNVELSDSDKYLLQQYPCLDTPVALETFKLFLLHAGHCPKCNDLLFPEICRDDNGVYSVVKKCMDRNCSYTLDVSEDFNNQLGITMPKDDLDCEQDEIDKEYALNGLSDDLIERQARLNKKRGIGHLPSAYWSLSGDVSFTAPQKDLDTVVELIGECPSCTGKEFDVTIQDNIMHNRMEAEARCTICNSVFDVTDYCAFVSYKDTFPDILIDKYNIRVLSDCEMRFLRKANVPSCTGTLKNSFADMNNRDAFGERVCK